MELVIGQQGEKSSWKIRNKYTTMELEISQHSKISN